jgi:iron complex transport system ATP-binding protein
MSTPVVEVRNLRFAYPLPGSRWREVLRGVDLRLEQGELVALLGTNGSGKTTLLRVLAGTLRAGSGSIDLFGRPLAEFSRAALARRVAVLPQSLELPAGFRAGELVEMGRAPHAQRRFGPTRADEEAVERALIDADALDLAHRHIEELSGGERQRVLVAMALAQEPDLLLLDEPTLHLDLAHQVALLNAIDRLRLRRGLAVLAVLHDLNLATAFAPRVALLSAGVVVADGPPGDVLTPDRVREAFGVAVEDAHTRAGDRVLAVRRGTMPASSTEPLPSGRTIGR